MLFRSEPNILVVNAALPVTNVKELIALAKAKPGELNYGYSGTGGSTQLTAELFKSMTGVNMVGVNYKASVGYATAAVSNEVQLVFAGLAAVVPHIKSGKLRAIAITSAKPSALAPGMPTVAASGLPGYDWIGISGIYARAGTPQAVIRRLNQEIVRSLNQSEVREKVLTTGTEVMATSPEEFAAIINTEIAKTSKVLKALGIKPE